VELADRDRLDAVSMRRIANELGVSAPSLYWHVRSKNELYD
jgi:AcrR family transcriptional regulator